MNGDPQPKSIDLDREKGLTITWHDGARSFYPLAYLRRMSPSADMRQLRTEMATNRLVVLPDAGPTQDLRAIDAQLVGRYALRITFSDGHRTGIYSWDYLRSIDPDRDHAQADGPEP